MPASSKKQQKFMGIVHGIQKGEIDPSTVSKDAQDVAKTIKKSDAKDFASTKHKGLPTKVKKENMTESTTYISDRKTIDKVFKNVFGDKLKDIKYKDSDEMIYVSYNDIDPRNILDFAGERSKNIKRVQKILSKIYKKDIYVILYTKSSNQLGYGIESPMDESIIKENENMDELFEQLFNEGAFPDRTTPTDSFTEPGTDILDFDKERNERIKKEVVKRLKQEAFPDNWLVGRKGNNHTATKTAPRTYDDDRANFIVRNSGQPDLEKDLDEHHEDYPDDILQMSVGDFLTKSKEKDEELYHGIESIIDKFIGDESVNEGVFDNIKHKINGTFHKQTIKIGSNLKKPGDLKNLDTKEKKFLSYVVRKGEPLFKKGKHITYVNPNNPKEILGGNDLAYAYSVINDMEEWGDISKEELQQLRTGKIEEVSFKSNLDESVNESKSVTIKFKDGKLHHYPGYDKETVIKFLTKNGGNYISPISISNGDTLKSTKDFTIVESKLYESSMGELNMIASESPTFQKFVQNVFKEFKDFEKTKEAIAWLKSIYDDRTNESVNEGWKDWFKKKSKPTIDPGAFKQQALKALEKALKDDDIYPGEIEEWLETKVTHRYGGYDAFGNDKSPERLSDKDMFTAKGIISDWERYDAKGDNKGVESSKKNLYNHLKKTLKESVVDEAITVSINTLSDLIPDGEFDNKQLKHDLVAALNGIYKKYNINRRLR